MTSFGALKVSTSAPQSFEQGHGFTLDGSLCVDIVGTPVFGYINGLPVTITGALKCQMNVAFSLHDTIVGGIRVGPNGGIYLIDTSPDIPGGFSNGFSNGFNVFGGHVPPVAFTPLELFINGEQGAWYDPSDFSTMFQDSAGSIPVTAVGQTVGCINDKSGNNNHATQATSASRPVLRQDANSKYYLEFDGVDDSLATASFSMAVANASVFSGVTNNQPSSFGLIYTFGVDPISDIGSFGLYTYISSSGDFGPGIKGTLHYYAASSGATIPRTGVLTVSYDVTAAIGQDSVGLRENSVAQSLTFQAGGPPAGTVFGTWPLYIGQRGDNSARFNGRIYSMIVRGAESNQLEIEQTEAWVNGKTGAY